MNIAILTQPLGHNYGGLLQAYALQTYLKGMGCHVETLDRRFESLVTLTVKNNNSSSVKICLENIKSNLIKRHREWVLANLVSFRKRKLIMSPPINNEIEIRNYFKGRDIDVFLVGSDQVWRPQYSPSILNFYLDFLDDVGSNASRIAYAASFGVDQWEYSDDLTDKCRKLAGKFDAVSVRESSAIKLCNEKLGVDAQLVLDPTMLLSIAEYKKLIDSCDQVENVGDVVYYSLDPSMIKENIANLIGSALGEKVFTVNAGFESKRALNSFISKRQFISIERWLYLFYNSSFVVTDSFHGTVFSILFNKPFVAIANSARGMARFDSLLTQFGLSERLIESSDGVSSHLLKNQIKWSKVNEKLDLLVGDSRNYLEVCLSSYK